MSAAVPAPEEDTATAGPSRGRSLLWSVVVALVLLVLVRAFVVQSFVIPTPSMRPELEPGDRVLVARWTAHLGEVARGDLVVFDGAGVFEPAAPDVPGLPGLARSVAGALGVPVDESAYAKRVVGLPGERIACCDADGLLTIDGEPLREPWLADGVAPSRVRFDVEVPEGRLFVLGDNRDDSADSRAHLGDPGGGTVPTDRIVGRVVAVYWPLDRIGTLNDGEERG